MGMNTREFEAWLARIPVLTNLPTDDEREVMELLGGKGLTALLGLLLGERQGLYAQLSYHSLGNEEVRYRAAVTQGKIQGIERIIQTVRDLAVSDNTDNADERSH